MSAGSTAHWQALMRREWNARARRNAMHYIAADRPAWDSDAFFQSGERAVALYVEPFLQDRGFDPAPARMLEIGCGVGRMTRALARHFAHVAALDVSPEMVAQGRDLLGAVPNITWQVGNGLDLSAYADNSFDFVFSYIVFQHVPSAEIVLGYVGEIGRVLRPGGLFKFQTRTLIGEPPGLWILRTRFAVRAWHVLARRLRGGGRGAAVGLGEAQDALKGRHYQTWVGNAVPIVRLRRALRAAGLAFEITNPGTQYTWVSGHKPQA